MQQVFVIYFSIGFGVVLALVAAGYDSLKSFHWIDLVVGHVLAFVLWPVAVWNNRNTISVKGDRRIRRGR